MPQFTSSQKLVNLSVAVTGNLGNVSQVKLFHNNKLIGIEEDLQNNVIQFEARLTNTFGEDNFFYSIAAGKNGIETEKQKLVVKYMGKTDEKPKLFVITIGIDEYRNPKYNLNYATADADAFQESLIKGSSKLFEDIREIKVRNADFTKNKIQTIFQKVQEEANEQDLLIFYYAGHGVMSEGLGSETDFYLVPYDVTQLYGRDDLLKEKGISATDLKELSRKINAQKQVFILDACQSAAALDAMARRVSRELEWLV